MGSSSPVDNFAPQRLRELRETHSMTKADLATHAGLPRPNVSAFEYGRRRPGADSVIALADALGVDPLELTTATPATITLADLRLQARHTPASIATEFGVSYFAWYLAETGRRPLSAPLRDKCRHAFNVDDTSLDTAQRNTLAARSNTQTAH